MAAQHGGELNSFLDHAIESGQVDPEVFRRLVLSGFPEPPIRFNPQTMSASLHVLRRALDLNPDASTVVKWFNTSKLEPFGFKTPAEMVSGGQSGAMQLYRHYR